MSIFLNDTFTGSSALSAHSSDDGHAWSAPLGDGTVGSGILFTSNSPMAAINASPGNVNDPLIFSTTIKDGTSSAFFGVGVRCVSGTPGNGYYVIVFAGIDPGPGAVGVYKIGTGGLVDLSLGASLAHNTPTDVRLVPTGISGGSTTLQLSTRPAGGGSWTVIGTVTDTDAAITGNQIGLYSAGTAGSVSTGISIDSILGGTPPILSAVGVTLNYFDQSAVSITADAFTGGSGGTTYQWYRSSVNNDTIGNASCHLLSGKTSLALIETSVPSPAAGSGGLWWYFCVGTDSSSNTARTVDKPSPLADYPPLAIAFYGTSIVYIDGTTSADSPPYICGRMISRMRGLRRVGVVNGGIGGSSSADWLPSASNSSPFGAGNYYTGFLNTQVAALETAMSRTVDYFFIMHETNDWGQSLTPTQYLNNMQTTITALSAARPLAKFLVSYAPYDHGLDDDTIRTNAGNNGIASMQASTDTLVANNPGVVFDGSKYLFRYSAANYLEADFTTDFGSQPANRVHYGSQGRESIAHCWAAGIEKVIFPPIVNSRQMMRSR